MTDAQMNSLDDKKHVALHHPKTEMLQGYSLPVVCAYVWWERDFSSFWFYICHTFFAAHWFLVIPCVTTEAPLTQRGNNHGLTDVLKKRGTGSCGKPIINRGCPISNIIWYFISYTYICYICIHMYDTQLFVYFLFYNYLRSGPGFVHVFLSFQRCVIHEASFYPT